MGDLFDQLTSLDIDVFDDAGDTRGIDTAPDNNGHRRQAQDGPKNTTTTTNNNSSSKGNKRDVGLVFKSVSCKRIDDTTKMRPTGGSYTTNGASAGDAQIGNGDLVDFEGRKFHFLDLGDLIYL